MNILLDILFACSIKFFIFDFSHLRWMRDFLLSADNWFINKLFKCPYCQGFWCGFLTHGFKYHNSIFEDVFFGFCIAIICLCWNAIFWPLIDKYEQKYDYDLCGPRKDKKE